MDRLPRFFLEPRREKRELDQTVALTPEDSHHLHSVLRLGIGARVECAEPSTGTVFLAEVADLEESVRVQLKEKRTAPDAALPPTTLFFALCKGDRNDSIVEKGVELGVNSILFFEADRSVAKGKNPKKKLERWRRIALAAAKQSSRSTLPSIQLAQSLRKAIERAALPENTRLLCAALGDNVRSLNVFSEPFQAAALAVGPEGDFSPSEYDLLSERGFQLVSLGPLVLRSETAALCGLSLLNASRYSDS